MTVGPEEVTSLTACLSDTRLVPCQLRKTETEYVLRECRNSCFPAFRDQVLRNNRAGEKQNLRKELRNMTVWLKLCRVGVSGSNSNRARHLNPEFPA